MLFRFVEHPIELNPDTVSDIPSRKKFAFTFFLRFPKTLETRNAQNSLKRKFVSK